MSSIIIANLLLGRLEEAESVRSVYGPGSQEYKLQIEYMRAYSQRGDVARECCAVELVVTYLECSIVLLVVFWKGSLESIEAF